MTKRIPVAHRFESELPHRQLSDMHGDDTQQSFDWVPEWLPRFQLAPAADSPGNVENEHFPPGHVISTTRFEQHELQSSTIPSQQTQSLSPSSAGPARGSVSSHESVSNDFLLPGPERGAHASSASGATSTHTPNTSIGPEYESSGTAVRSGNVKTVVVLPNPERTVKRELRSSHLFMITINATLGVGLYWKSGLVLHLGGPLIVLISFLVVGLLAWAVMQCITEMLCIWPVPGALSVYVSEFVDVELGIAVGITYWQTLLTTHNREDWANPLNSYDKQAAPNWFVALLLSISTVAWSYVGVEIVAASALEVRPPKHVGRSSTALSRRSEASLLIGKTVRWSSIWIPVLVCFAYTLSGVWSVDKACEEQEPKSRTSSAFVTIAERSGIPYLGTVFNIFLLFTALTCAMTNLYVASRSMFGLASRLDRGPGQPLVLRILAWFGKTNRHKVPMRAMIFSSLAFIWVPLLYLKENGASSPIAVFVEVLGNMGTVGVFIVWACECLAFLRFYYCMKRHQHALELAKVSQVRRWDYKNDDYPYRSHGQPFTAYMGLAGCLFLLLVCNIAYFWAFHLEPFLSSYLIVFVFLLIWATLKLFRGARWALVDLSDAKRVVQKMKNLHDLRQGAM
ncbi:amino acid permease-domain-containing protein [Microdochium bolleyi]|uniref:Amino acid permease-domain-containing protein n=1 Tax=Microdochium bolleyi TaxID=196109 RepID=A0A136J489_9PEZI|nr:amino acid permease-domain-containing protein [Microdochium bolleyi]